jgi:quercetin dioxygenase-like cupin family protein
MEIDRPDTKAGELPDEYKPHFQGTARLQRLTSPFKGGPDVFFVHFDAGGRTKPHVHHSGQVLHVVSGDGIVADGSGRQRVRPGDTIAVRPDEWHWHGGSPTSAMTHLTVQWSGGDVSWDVEERDWSEDYS